MTISSLTSASEPFWTNIYSKKVLHHTVPKTLYFPSLFRENVSFSKIYFRKNYPWHSYLCQFKNSFRIKNRLSSKFTFKDTISKEMCSLFYYKFQCSSCNATYYGKTEHHFKVCVSEHMGIFASTGKNIKSTKNSAPHDHMLVCNNIATFLFWIMEPMISENCKKVFY